MTDEPAEIDWEAEARRLGLAMAEIVAISATALPTGGNDPAAIIERAKILGFMASILDASKRGEGPIRIEVTGNLSEREKQLVPRVVEAAIDGLMRAIEEGEHGDVAVKLIKVSDANGETKQ